MYILFFYDSIWCKLSIPYFWALIQVFNMFLVTMTFPLEKFWPHLSKIINAGANNRFLEMIIIVTLYGHRKHFVISLFRPHHKMNISSKFCWSELIFVDFVTNLTQFLPKRPLLRDEMKNMHLFDKDVGSVC